MKKIILSTLAIALCSFFINCNTGKKSNDESENSKNMESKLKELITVKLTTDLTKLTSKEKQMIPLLIEVAKLMDDIFWVETFGDKEKFLNGISDSLTKRFAEINYGPWERLGDDKSFISSFGEKPLGANFYPADMTKEEFEKLKDKNKTSLYTLIKRNDDKSLKVVWYHEAFKEKIEKAASLLKEAAKLAEDEGLKKYLNMRAEALLTDNYQPSDMAWMDMKNNTIDFVVGPIETYEDGLFGYKASHEAVILIKDKEWSKRLDKYIATLPDLQKQLPVDEKYKAEKPGKGSDLNAYEIIYYAGNSNAGGKTIAINLPNDEQVQLKKGSRRLQLKNSIKAKFDNILVPISNVLIDESQRKYIKFNAFFNNIMFHEVAHGLGIKQTLNGKGSVREAMQNTASGFEEAKADILGLFMVTKLIE
ncbi:MAG: Zn-dependent hydrolase [Bacteroidales bacterium]|nr:Zn-dependent hydrolase [Bacteroidales bacterium]